MDFLKQIGISSIVKGFVIFSCYGFFTVIYIHIAHGLDASLPNGVMSTLEGPISLYTFGWLALVGLALLMIMTKLGFSDIDMENKRPKRVFYIAVPICESAIALGVVIGATFLGIALGAHFLYRASFTSITLYPVFYTFAWAMFIFTYPVCMFVLYILDTKNKVRRYLNIASTLYIISNFSFLYVGLPLTSVVETGVIFSFLILAYLVIHYHVGKS
ncbi:hypothetical protein JFJ08_17655 [Vibrio atlanticus]|nr:hypothetical protein [Vibrio atlanticus]